MTFQFLDCQRGKASIRSIGVLETDDLYCVVTFFVSPFCCIQRLIVIIFYIDRYFHCCWIVGVTRFSIVYLFDTVSMYTNVILRIRDFRERKVSFRIVGYGNLLSGCIFQSLFHLDQLV